MANKALKRGPRRRGRTPYVRLLAPQQKGHRAWRTESLDPETREYHRRVIPPEHSVDPATRQDYCKAMSERIMQRLREIAAYGGHGPQTKKTYADAREEWLRDFAKEYPSSASTYRSGIAYLTRWWKAQRLRTLAELRPLHLASFRLMLNDQVPAPGSRNKIRNHALTFLKWCFAMGYLAGFPRVEDITFARWKDRKQTDAPYRPEELRALFEAAERLEQHSRQPDNQMHEVDVFPLLVLITLSGMRLSAACSVLREDFHPDTLDYNGAAVGSLDVRRGTDKGGAPRTVMLDYSPGLRRYLRQLTLTRGRGQTLAGVTRMQTDRIARELRGFGAEAFMWKRLRTTASSYLSSSQSIFGSSAADQSADRLGHSTQTARQHYLTVIPGVSRDAKTLEAAMQIEDIIDRLCGGPRPSDRLVNSADDSSSGR